MANEKGKEGLDALLKASNFKGIHHLLEASANLTDAQCDAIAARLAAIDTNRIAATKGWYPVMRVIVKRSSRLRGHLFRLLASSEMSFTSNAMVNNARDNILLALRQLILNPDEIAIIKRLRENLLPPVYREYCDEVLLSQMNEEDRGRARRKIISRAYLRE